MKPKMKEFLKQMGRLQEEDYVTAEEFYGMFSKILDAVKAASVNNENKLSELNKIADKKAKELESYFVTLLEAVDERMGEVKNGNDGKDGETPVAGVDYPSYDEIRSFIKEQVEKLPQPGSAAEEITVDYIKDALMSLEGNDRLPYSAINGIEQFIDEKVRIMESTMFNGPRFVGGGATSGGGNELNIAYSPIEPSSPSDGDLWIDTSEAKPYWNTVLNILHQTPHTQYIDGVTDSEIFRYTVPSGQKLVLTGMEVAQRGGGSEDTDFTIEVYDVTGAAQLAICNLNEVKSLSVTSDAAITYSIRVTNGVGSDIDACYSIKGYYIYGS